MKKPLTILLALALSSLCASAATIRVPADQPTIQAGIDAAADGDTVVLADGIYTGEGNRDIVFNARKITLHSANGPENCIIDAQSSEDDEHFGLTILHHETRDTIIDGLTIIGGSSGIKIDFSNPTIRNCVVTSNGIGIQVWDSVPRVETTIVSGNSGNGIWIYYCGGGATVYSSQITHNGDSGIHCSGGEPRFINCLIAGNSAAFDGGGIYCSFSVPDLINCTIAGNTAVVTGGGVCSEFTSNPTLENCIIAENSASRGDQFALLRTYDGYTSDLTISYSDVPGNTRVDSGCDLYLGPGMLYGDPLFVTGPWGPYFLSQTAAGQGADSPCVDAGNPASTMISGTTRTDTVQDSGVVDMGYHQEEPIVGPRPETLILSGPEGRISCPVAVFTFTGSDEEYPASALSYSWRFADEPWSDWSPRAWAAINDLEESADSIRFEVRARNPQGVFDPTPANRSFWYSEDSFHNLVATILGRIVVGPGPGPGNPPLVRTGLAQWTAYSVMRYGVNVAAGDIDGDGVDEVITGPGPGAEFGPHVRCFRPNGEVVSDINFLAYGTNKFGVNVTAGDVDGDGFDEIITGAGPGAVFGPHVRGWNRDGSPGVAPIQGISFFAYGTLKWGVNMACGDIDGDGTDEIVTGAGPGPVFGPHVRGWRYDGSTTAPMSAVSFFAFATPQWGVNVACGDLDGDGIDEIITGAGPGPAFSSHVRAWNFDGTSIAQMEGVNFFAYHSSVHYGVAVGAADIDDDGLDELVVLPGPGPENGLVLRAWNVESGEPESIPNYEREVFDTWMTHGGNIAGSKNGWEPSVHK